MRGVSAAQSALTRDTYLQEIYCAFISPKNTGACPSPSSILIDAARLAVRMIGRYPSERGNGELCRKVKRLLPLASDLHPRSARTILYCMFALTLVQRMFRVTLLAHGAPPPI